VQQLAGMSWFLKIKVISSFLNKLEPESLPGYRFWKTRGDIFPIGMEGRAAPAFFSCHPPGISGKKFPKIKGNRQIIISGN
jgi:hypothetical protein